MPGQRHAIPSFIDTTSALDAMLKHLRSQKLIALDVEADSLYHYYPKVCLIQLSAQAEAPEAMADYLVDPLSLTHLEMLGELLADHDIEVVMHAAENDMRMLAQGFGFRFERVFDTQLAARILGWPRTGLAALLSERFDVQTNKRMQRADWSQRPLSPEQVSYAADDTHYLSRLRDILIDELRAKDRFDEAQAAFAQIVIDIRQAAAADTEARTFWDMKGVREVPREQHGVLAALWEWREAEARRLDRPPFKIVNDAVLMALADTAPRDLRELARTPGLSQYVERRWGNALLKTIDAGLRRPLPARPMPRARPEQALDEAGQSRFERLREWRNRTAVGRGVALDIVLNTATLVEIARRDPCSLDNLNGVAGLTPWKLHTYGPAILAQLKQP